MRFAVIILMGVVWAAPTQGQEKLRPRDGSLKVGDAAPDLTLQRLDGKARVKLADLRGKPAVLVFGSCT